MVRTRIIPTLLLHDQSLVKTVKFGSFVYVGDPCNTVRIFNEFEVDELLFLDINATVKNREPDFKLLKNIASECFMPLAYGGGISCLEQAKRILDIGFEKIVLNSHVFRRPDLIDELSEYFGAQAVVVAIDAKKDLLGRYKVSSHAGTNLTKLDPVEWAAEAAIRGAGEILATAIDREGTWSGFDVELVKNITASVNIPVIAHGGAGTAAHIEEVLDKGGASAVGVGSMVTFQKQGMGVLVNFPDTLKQIR